MTTWNYRVIKKTSPVNYEVTYQIHEVYYKKNGHIDCWNDTPVEPMGINEPGLRNDIQSFLGAFRLPVLQQRYINGKARLVAEYSGRPDRDLISDYVGKTSRAAGYINQILGSHLLLKQEPKVRKAYDKVDQALNELFDLVNNKHTDPVAESA
jgi:hypothetical protein